MVAQPEDALGFGSVVFAQIRWLISNMTRKNQKSSASELAHLLGMYGECAFTFLVRCLLEDIDFRESRVQQHALKLPLLTQQFGKLVTRPNFASLIGEAFGGAALSAPLTDEWLVSVGKAIRATPAQQLALGLGIAQLAEAPLAAEGDKFLRARLAELPKETAAVLPDELLHSLLYFLGSREGLAKPRAALVKLLQGVFTEDKAPLTLVPLLYGAERETCNLNSRLSYPVVRDAPAPSFGSVLLSADAADVAELMRDLGYSCCASAKCVAELLAQFGDGQLANPEASIAAAVGMMASTATSLDDSLSLHGAFSTAVSGKYLEFDAKFDDEDGGADTQALTAWNVEAFVDGVREALPSLSWPAVFDALDQPDVAVDIGAAGFELAVAVHKRACGGKPLSSSALLGEWSNGGAQLCLLSHAVEASAADVAWGEAAGPLVTPPPEGTNKPGLAPWLSLKLTEALLRLSAVGYYAEAHALFSKPLLAAPQLLLAALLTHSGAAAGSPRETALQRELLEDLFPLFLGGDSPGSAALLQRLWPVQPYAVMRGMAQLHAAQPQSILRLLDLATSFNALEQVLQLRAFSFTIDLAACAQRKELIDLEPWLNASLARDSEHAFVRACASYLGDKMLVSSSTNLARAASATSLNVLSVDAAATFFRILTAAPLPPPLAAELADLYAQCVKAKPKLQALFAGPSAAAAPPPAENKPPGIGLVGGAAPAAAAVDKGAGAGAADALGLSSLPLPVGLGAEAAPVASAPASSAPTSGAPLPGMPGGEAMSFPPDIEEVANSYFQKIYSDAASIDDIIAVLKQFQAAPAQSREQKVYVCMVHNLFDEYRYFPKYPDKPLRTTAVLFGALVQHGLVANITLGLFLRYVLEAVKKPPLSKMNKFGLTALEQFLPRVAEWPQYCQLLLGIPHLGQVNPELPAFLEAAVAGHAGKPPPALLGADGPVGTGAAIRSILPAGNSADVLPQIGSLGEPATLGSGLVPSLTHGGGAPGLGAPGLGGVMPPTPPTIPPAPGLHQLPPQPPQPPPQPPQPPHPPPGFAPHATPLAADLPAVSMVSALSGVGGFGREGCIETLMTSTASSEIRPPPDSVQDRIGFVLNNMAPGNVATKALELLDALRSHDGSVSWFANYLVVRRVALEPNFHGLYTSLLEALGLVRLYRAILESTLQNARVLLSSPKIRSSSSERSLLKNLGSWLGQITLARNRPLLMRDLDLKELVCDAYERGRLIAVVPFVCKVLDACSSSRVFLPPNPWVMALMSLLMELYQVPDLKLNLKFEIEVLAKTLKVELADIQPTRKLCHRSQDRAQTCDFANRAGPAAGALGAAGGFGGVGGIGGGFGSASSPAFAMPGTEGLGQHSVFSNLQQPHLQPPPPPPPPSQPGGAFGAAPVAATAQFGNNAAAFFAQQQAQQQAQAQALQVQQLQAQQQAQAAAQSQGSGGGGAAALAAQLAAAEAEGRAGEGTVIPNLSSYVQLNPGLYSQQPALKRVVPLALDRAIREIISPVVERSVTISCVTTRELMLKDFAMEPDEMRMRKAAQLMVSNLAGSLALVTCKEPLRVACSNHMRVLLQQTGTMDAQLMEQVVQVCSSDNLELGCTLIEKAATEKAVRDIEEALAPAFAIRRKHREQTGLPYYDMSIFTSGRYPTGLPEALRPKPGGLLPTQRRVYEDFGRIPRGAPMVAPAPQQPGGMPPMGAAGGPQPPQPGAGLGGLPAGLGGAGEASALGFGRQAGQPGGLPGLVGGMPPGFGGAPAAAPQAAAGGAVLSQAEALERLALILSKLDLHVAQLAPQGVGIGALPASHELHQLLARVGECLTYCVQRDEVALSMAGSVFKRMYEQAASSSSVAARLATQVNVSVLARIHAVCKKVGQFVADMLLYADDERNLHEEIVLSLILAQVVAMSDLSPRLAKHLAASRSAHSIAFCAWLVRRTILDEPLVAATEAKELLGALAVMAQQPSPPEGLLRLLDDLRAALAVGGAQGGRLPKPPQPAVQPPAAQPVGVARGPPPEPPDPALARAREQLAPLWAEWLGLYGQQGSNERGFVAQLQTAGWLRPDEHGERFLRVMTELAVSAAHTAAPAPTAADGAKPPLAMPPLDAYSRLVVVLLKSLTPEPAPSGARDTSPAAVAATGKAQLAMLTKVLGALVAHLLRSHAHSAAHGVAAAVAHHRHDPSAAPPPFNQRAYLRLMGNWLLDLAAPEPALDTLQPSMLFAFAAALDALRPARVPGFAFGWLELVAHRAFMPKLLLARDHKGWPRLQKLLVALFSFLYPALSMPRLAPPTKHLYRGALRVLLVLLHDFPEFLCDYHLAICDAIPPTCIQMRNLVLSAFPRNMLLPDPFTPNLKVNALSYLSISVYLYVYLYIYIYVYVCIDNDIYVYVYVYRYLCIVYTS